MPALRFAALFAAACVLPAIGNAQARWTLRADLRIGSADEGPALFSDIRGIAVGERGAIFILDFKAQEIRMFDARGQFIKRVARQGSGPGEIRNANGLQMAPDGSIWVNDPANARFSVFSPGGEFVRQHIVPMWGYGYIWDAMVDRGGVLNESIPVRNGAGTSTPFVRRLHPAGAKIDTIPLPVCAMRVANEPAFVARGGGGATSYYGVPFLATPIYTWDTRGFIWCSSRDRYAVLALGLTSGDTAVRIETNVPPLPVPKAGRDSVINRIRQGFDKLGVPHPDFSRVPTTMPAISVLDADHQGNVWVRRAGTGAAATIDIWDSAGKLRAVLTAPFRPTGSHHLLIRGDTVYAVVTDADDVPQVIRALLVR